MKDSRIVKQRNLLFTTLLVQKTNFYFVMSDKATNTLIFIIVLAWSITMVGLAVNECLTHGH
jgi:hypothetical protein